MALLQAKAKYDAEENALKATLQTERDRFEKTWADNLRKAKAHYKGCGLQPSKQRSAAHPDSRARHVCGYISGGASRCWMGRR